MKKSLKILGIVIIIIVILFVAAWMWVSGFKKDQKDTKNKVKEVVDNYPNFNKAVNEFSEARNKFYEYKENLYLETLSQKTNDWNVFIKSYADAIVKVEESAKNLKGDCKIKYGDVRANSKCTTFKANYEAAVNYYISDIKMYNKLIDEYIEWNKKQNNKYQNPEKGTFPVSKKYIDYDNDGKYFGKEEVKENE